MFRGEVLGFGAVLGEVIEFPRLVVPGDEFPAVVDYRAIPLMFEKQRALRQGATRERGQQRSAFSGFHRPAIALGGIFRTGQFGESGQDVDDRRG